MCFLHSYCRLGWHVQGKTTRIYHNHLDRCKGHYRSPAAKLVGFTAASGRLVIAQHPFHLLLYVTTSSICHCWRLEMWISNSLCSYTSVTLGRVYGHAMGGCACEHIAEWTEINEQ
jgi:hypothetical protein